MMKMKSLFLSLGIGVLAAFASDTANRSGADGFALGGVDSPELPFVDERGAWCDVVDVDGIPWSVSVFEEADGDETARVGVSGILRAVPEFATGDVLVPSEIAGVEVVGIDDFAFQGCSNLVSVTVPDGVTHVGDFAFHGCDALVSLSLPCTATNLSPMAFFGCPVEPEFREDAQTGQDRKSAVAGSVRAVKTSRLAAVSSGGGDAMCVVSFDANGGSVEKTSETFPSGEPLGRLPIPTRDGYVFEGWYDSPIPGVGTLVTTQTVAPGIVLSLYARWVLPDTDPWQPVFRFYSKKYKGHFYTMDQAECAILMCTNPNWKYEGVAYYAAKTRLEGTVPLHRFYSKNYRGHFYTIDEAEMQTVRDTNPNWKYEGVAFYVYPDAASAPEGSATPIYRFWSKEYRHHFYTISESEMRLIRDTNPNWKYEMVSFWTQSVPSGKHNSVQLWEGGPYWAEMNIGAEKPEDYGFYFWWGDTVGYRREGNAWVASDGSSQNFSFGSDNTPTYEKDNASLRSEGWITADGVLAPEHDAARVHWGGAWRMPTISELNALSSNCDWTWTARNGVNGYVVRGRGDYSANSIFLPAAGHGEETFLYDVGYGRYRSSSPDKSYPSYVAWYLEFDSGDRISGRESHYYGDSVRPVQDFAELKESGFTVRFIADGGTGEMPDEEFLMNVPKNLPSNAFTREGYDFDGWAVSSGGPLAYDDRQLVANLGNEGETVELFARWTPISYTVKFNANGGAGTMLNQSFKYGTAQTLTANTFTRRGYTFSGWATSATGAKAYSDMQSVNNLTSTSGGTVNLYAVWKSNRSGVQLWEGGPYWAEMNIGAEKPEDCGLYFWWGDTVGYRREGNAWVASDGSSQNFSFGSDNTPTYGKDNASLRSEGWITADGALAPEHDAARVHWGGAWRMPTITELNALVNNCDWSWTTRNGVNGYVVRGRGDYSANSIFLPAAGFGDGTSLDLAGSYGSYWSSVPGESYSDYAWFLYFNSGRHSTFSYYYRDLGQFVRPVQGFAQ